MRRAGRSQPTTPGAAAGRPAPPPPRAGLRSVGPAPGRRACAEPPPRRPSPTPVPAAAAAASPFLSALSSSCFLFPPPSRPLSSSSSGADAHVGSWRQTRRGGARAACGISRGCRRRCFPFSPAVSAESAECVLRARNTHLLLKKPKKNLKKPFKKPKKKNLQKSPRLPPAGDFYFIFLPFYKITR